MFTIHKTDTGAVTPFEYKEAVAGVYKVGTFLGMNEDGYLQDVGGNPLKYLCMADTTLKEAGVIPVVRVNNTMILKSELGEDLSEMQNVGAQMDVSNDGQTVVTNGFGICLEIVALDGKETGDTVYVRLM